MEPIALYLHIPFCMQKCAYCDFASYVGQETQVARYCMVLAREMARGAQRYGRRQVRSVFLGGGTPTLLTGGQVTSLLDAVRACFDVLPDAEITMEGNPGTLRADDVAAYVAAGVNRVSLGAQAAQSGLLVTLGRIHRWPDVQRGVAMLRAAGVGNINLDLMFGLPGQSMDEWCDTLDNALALAPQHLSCYGLQVEEGTSLATQIRQGLCLPLPSEDDERAMYHLARRKLEAAGFAQYEISNFARPGFQCRHNLQYWHCGEYLGLGCAAHSYMDGQRFGNTPSLKAYLSSRGAAEVERGTVSDADARGERLMLGLRLTEGVPADWVGDKLAGLVARGLLEETGGRARLTARGMDVQNTVLVELI